jgi:hypothetical protein
MSNNSSFNSPPVLTKIKNATTPFSLVLLPQESNQHLNSSNVFSLLFSFISQPPIVDSLNTDSTQDFEDLLFHFVYGSTSSSSSNTLTATTSQEEFKAFAKLSIHVFSSSSFFYYALH